MTESQNHRTYEDENVHQITKSTKNNYKKKHDTQKKLSKCKFCGKDHVWKKELCPAYNKTCSKCGKLNHFKSQCRNTQTEVTNFIYTIKENNVASINDIANEDSVTLDTKFGAITLQIDTGATCNIIPVHTYIQLTGDSELNLINISSYI